MIDALVTLAILNVALVTAALWKIGSLQERLRVLTARVEKGAPLTDDELVHAEEGRAPTRQ